MRLYASANCCAFRLPSARAAASAPPPAAAWRLGRWGCAPRELPDLALSITILCGLLTGGSASRISGILTLAHASSFSRVSSTVNLGRLDARFGRLNGGPAWRGLGALPHRLGRQRLRLYRLGGGGGAGGVAGFSGRRGSWRNNGATLAFSVTAAGERVRNVLGRIDLDRVEHRLFAIRHERGAEHQNADQQPVASQGRDQTFFLQSIHYSKILQCVAGSVRNETPLIPIFSQRSSMSATSFNLAFSSPRMNTMTFGLLWYSRSRASLICSGFIDL